MTGLIRLSTEDLLLAQGLQVTQAQVLQGPQEPQVALQVAPQAPPGLQGLRELLGLPQFLVRPQLLEKLKTALGISIGPAGPLLYHKESML